MSFPFAFGNLASRERGSSVGARGATSEQRTPYQRLCIRAVVPDTTGRPWIAGRQTLIINPDDPLANRFAIRRWFGPAVSLPGVVESIQLWSKFSGDAG